MVRMQIKLPPLFDEDRAAQAAAYLLQRAGEPLTVLKLMKLLYLAERRSLQLHAVPLVGDVPVAMQHGPVLSRTLDLINGSAAGTTGAWDALIAERGPNHEVTLRDGAQAFGALSRADLRVLDETWQQFGGMLPWDLVRHCHRNLPEWESPGYGAIEIPVHRIFRAFGLSAEEAEAAVEAQAREARAMHPDIAPFY
jgi:uncharacterized phage-associated protein